MVIKIISKATYEDTLGYLGDEFKHACCRAAVMPIHVFELNGEFGNRA